MLHGTLSQYSQPGVLKDRMAKAGFTHGREARVNLRGLNVRRAAEGKTVVYFCNIDAIDVLEVTEEGDGLPLPEEVEVEGLYFTGYGSYDLQEVILSSNGVVKVKADEKTHAERRRPLQWARAARASVSAFFAGRW